MTPAARYDDVADFYVAEVGDSTTDPATAALLADIGEIAGATLLDLACGQGRVTRELARRGARVTGVDLSAELVDRARAEEAAHPVGITYRVGSAAARNGFEPGSFDGVVCNFGLTDIDDLPGTLDAVALLLRPGGFFAFSILHPHFPGWGENISSSWPPGGGYFDEGWWRTTARSSRIRRAVGSNHRTVSTYLNHLVRRGLAIASVRELPPPSEWLAADPTRSAVPTFLVVRCELRPR